jgi:hypothetical protein
MDALLATQSWNQIKISGRLDFLQRRGSASDSSQVSQAHALTQAAELALAIGDFETGWRLLQEAFTKYVTLETTEFSPTPTALLGAIVGRAIVTIAPNTLKIKCPEWKEFPWKAPTNLLASGIGALLAAAVATHQHVSEALPALLMEMPSSSNIDYGTATHTEQRREYIWLQRRLLSLAATSPEAGILSAFGLVRNPDFGILPGKSVAFEMRDEPAPPHMWGPALSMREERYAAQIRLVVQDWSLDVKPWLSLIDWGLLCWELAIGPVSEVPAADSSVRFIRELAKEITNAHPELRPTRTGSRTPRMRAN